jgi:GDPmannose 4,6-dehydratase
MKKALITGVTGQDGSYLAEFLLHLGYEVHGMMRPASVIHTNRLTDILDDARFHLHHGDILDAPSTERLVRQVQPDEIYNLAAQSHVGVSFKLHSYTRMVNAEGAVNVYNAALKIPYVRVYQASSSEMFGSVAPPQALHSGFNPVSPYGSSKLTAHVAAKDYRKRGLYISCGILFNHESPRRGENFVTRKITRALARISLGLQEHLYLGNIKAKRDWGYAPDYVFAMVRMLQQERPSDYLIATGESHSVEEFLQLAAQESGVDLKAVSIHPDLLRQRDIEELRVEPDTAIEEHNRLGWSPVIDFPDMVRLMARSDLALARQESLARASVISA